MLHLSSNRNLRRIGKNILGLGENSRFVDDAFGFALTWNYWFNDAVSTASDVVALQLILQYWTTKFPGWDGETESIAITAGETKDPARNMPKVVRDVFWRILLFYLLSVLILGLNIPYTTPGLDGEDSRTSPFTLVFQMAGSTAAGSFINAVIMTSVLSAGNHALFADRHAPQVLRQVEQKPGTLDCGSGYFRHQYSLLRSQLHWRWTAVDMATEVSTGGFLSSPYFVMAVKQI
ncbi:MAG: hypothetical protein Q9226_006684 [Calogaya cf. arnoldii]